jgi:nitrite reductase/ring-hydroxylating ferredoxin subunit
MTDFITVGKQVDVAEGDMRRFEVGATPVAVANVGGMLYAFGNTCTHQGCSLAQGELDGKTVTCPCHGSRFDVTSGAVVRGPATEPVPSYAVRVEGKQIQIRT